MNIKIKKINPNAVIPTKGSEYAAGYDLYACIDSDATVVTIPPHETRKVPTGIAIELPKEYFAGIYARSGLAAREGLRPANCVGICDSDYRGEYIVALHNDSNNIKIVKNGDRIAQMVIQPFLTVGFVETDELSETGRSDGSFGSTGK